MLHQDATHVVHGLVSRHDLNDALCAMLSATPNKHGRLAVQIVATHERVLVKPRNLRSLSKVFDDASEAGYGAGLLQFLPDGSVNDLTRDTMKSFTAHPVERAVPLRSLCASFKGIPVHMQPFSFAAEEARVALEDAMKLPCVDLSSMSASAMRTFVDGAGALGKVCYIQGSEANVQEFAAFMFEPKGPAVLGAPGLLLRPAAIYVDGKGMDLLASYTDRGGESRDHDVHTLARSARDFFRDPTCPVCWEREKAITMACGHALCAFCHGRVKAACPVCRRQK